LGLLHHPLRDARRTCAASGFSEIVAFIDLLLGRMHGIGGDLAASERLLREAIDEADALGQAGLVFEASIHLADAQCRSGSPSSGLRTLSDAREKVSAEYFDFYRPSFSRIRGSILDSAGLIAESVETLEKGATIADERGDAYELALLILTLARVEPGSVDSRRRAEAERALRALGVRSAPGIRVDS
jgi:hypothetical protein